MVDATTLKSTPKVLSTILYEGRRKTELKSGDRIIYCRKANTIAFSRDGSYLLIGGPFDTPRDSEDKFLVAPNMDPAQLVEIVCAAGRFEATPVEGMSAEYLMWDIRHNMQMIG